MDFNALIFGYISMKNKYIFTIKKHMYKIRKIEKNNIKILIFNSINDI